MRQMEFIDNVRALTTNRTDGKLFTTDGMGDHTRDEDSTTDGMDLCY